MSNNQVALYMPDYCVQGERIPFYALWDAEANNQITITLPPGITLVEIYNINLESLRIHENVCDVSSVEINGYIGGVFDSEMYDEASVTKKIKFQICNDTNTQAYEKQVELFRPDVQIDDKVGTINIKSNKRGIPIVNGNIKIFNHGKGTAVVRVKIMPDSDIQEGQAHGFEEFKIKFLKDLDDGLVELIEKFSQYKELLELTRSVLKNPLSIKIKQNVVRKTINDLDVAFEENENFLMDFARVTATAYIKNVSIITNADSFLAFLKSTGKNKLLILDAMKVFKIQLGTQTLKIDLQTTDLASNKYPIKKIEPIQIISDKSYDIPFYQIVDSSGDN